MVYRNYNSGYKKGSYKKSGKKKYGKKHGTKTVITKYRW